MKVRCRKASMQINSNPRGEIKREEETFKEVIKINFSKLKTDRSQPERP